MIHLLQRRFVPTNALQQTRHQHNPVQPVSGTGGEIVKHCEAASYTSPIAEM